MSFEHQEDLSKCIEEIRGSVKWPPNKFEDIPDLLSLEDLAAQASAVTKRMADKLVKRWVSGQISYLVNLTATRVAILRQVTSLSSVWSLLYPLLRVKTDFDLLDIFAQLGSNCYFRSSQAASQP